MSSFKELEDKNLVEHKTSKEINLKEIFEVLKRYVWVIALLTIITTSAGTFYSISTYTPMYQSTARIIIGADSTLITTLKVIIQDTTVLDKVVNKLDLTYPAETLSGKISVGSIESSQVVTITVNDTNAEQAAILANTIAETYKEQIPSIMGFKDVKLLSAAKVDHDPINQTQKRTIFVSIIGGIIVGVGFAFLLDSLNESVRKEDEVEDLLGIPVLGSVSKMKKKNMQRSKTKKPKTNYRSETLGS